MSRAILVPPSQAGVNPEQMEEGGDKHPPPSPGQKTLPKQSNQKLLHLLTLHGAFRAGIC